MRQKCEFCKTSPELNDKGTCPNCGAAMTVLMENCPNYLLDSGIVSAGDDRQIHGYPRPSGSAYNPMIGGITGTPSGMGNIAELARRSVYGLSF